MAASIDSLHARKKISYQIKFCTTWYTVGIPNITNLMHLRVVVVLDHVPGVEEVGHGLLVAPEQVPLLSGGVQLVRLRYSK